MKFKNLDQDMKIKFMASGLELRVISLNKEISMHLSIVYIVCECILWSMADEDR